MRFHQQSQSERSLLAKIAQFSSADLASFEQWQPKYLAHYLSQLRPWLEDAIYFLGIDSGHAPTRTEITEHILKSDSVRRFRAFYVLNFPECVEHSRVEHVAA